MRSFSRQDADAEQGFGSNLRSEGDSGNWKKARSGPARAWSANQEIEFSTDGNVDTKWCLIHEGRPVVGQLDSGAKGAVPTGYRFTSVEHVAARDPRAWTLEGSADGQAWTLLDEHPDEPVFARRHGVARLPRPDD